MTRQIKKARVSIEGSGREVDVQMDEATTVREILRLLGLNTNGGFEMVDPSRRGPLGLNERPFPRIGDGGWLEVSPRMDAGSRSHVR